MQLAASRVLPGTVSGARSSSYPSQKIGIFGKSFQASRPTQFTTLEGFKSQRIKLQQFNEVSTLHSRSSLRVVSSLATGGQQDSAFSTVASPFFRTTLDAMLQSYWEKTPTAVKAVNFLQEQQPGVPIAYDHVALRSFGVNGCGLEACSKFWLDHGYTRKDMLLFPGKKLKAYWYSPPAGHDDLPRVFISELCVGDLSPEAQDIIKKYTSAASGGGDASPYTALNGILGATPWPTPSHEDYSKLAEESEYAAWTLLNGFTLNHTTVSVHKLKCYRDITSMDNALITEAGIQFNNDGKLNISPDGGLIQSSTVADNREFTFAGGEQLQLPGAYIEFAERLVLPEFEHLAPEDVQESHRREGFEVGNADKIFESTNTR